MSLDLVSEEAQLAAVHQTGYAIEHIAKPSLDVQFAAVRRYGLAIAHIDNPPLKVQLTAVCRDELAIRCIRKPSLHVQITAIRHSRCAILHTPNKTTVMRIANAQHYINLLSPSSPRMERIMELTTTPKNQ